MKPEPLLIPKNLLLFFSGIGLLLIIFTIVYKLSNVDDANLLCDLLLDVGIVSAAVAWLVVLIDLFRNDVLNKTFWILALFLTGPISTILYLFKRQQYLK